MSFVNTIARHRRGAANAVAITILIVACILLSQVAEARPDQRIKRNKSKNHFVHSNSHKACYLLYKKRTSKPKHSFFAIRRTKPKPMAETD